MESRYLKLQELLPEKEDIQGAMRLHQSLLLSTAAQSTSNTRDSEASLNSKQKQMHVPG